MKPGVLTPFALALVTSLVLLLINCGSGSSNQGPTGQTATIKTTLSDPATCGAPQGAFSHIYVTVSDVQINQSASAGANDAGWVDLTPTLKSKPLQVDLLGMSNQCALQTLDLQAIPPGNYQQIRVILSSTTTGLVGNQCDVMANCLMLSSDLTNTPIPLQLSSETTTGIKIPSGQIAGGQLTASPGGNTDFNVDFNACASLIAQGGNRYTLNPVVHAAELNLLAKPATIEGTVVEAATGQPIVGGTTVVALEQKDSAGVDRLFMETVTASDGSFAFCPLPPGQFDVVASSGKGNGISYAASVITGVSSPAVLGNVPVVAVGAPAVLDGVITTSTGSAATSSNVQVYALQSITETVNGTSGNVMITIPLASQSAAMISLQTTAGSSCSAHSDCNSYSLVVPAASPGVGAFAAGGNQVLTVPPVAGPATYQIDAAAFVPGAAAQTGDCNPSEMQTGTIAATAGGNTTAPTLSFTGCQ